MDHVRHPRTAAWAAAAVLVFVPAAAGCSDDGGGGSESSPTPSVTAPSTPAEPGGQQPDDPAAAKAEIEKNWTTFFDPNASTEDRVRVLENGEAMRPVLAAFGGDPDAAQSSAKVTEVQFTSATGATVTYDLLVGGQPALPGAKGTAVHVDDTWKVSSKTLCALVKLSANAAVPGC